VKQILIAEDDPDVARVIAETLRDRLSAPTQVIANGALVPDALAAAPTALLILDISMPGLNGLDVFDLVRNDARWQGVPVLFLTGDPERAAEAFATTGVHRVMGKPFDVEQLVRAVREMSSADLGEGARATETAA
jgi:CheY-like chemotaxis protein